MAFNTKGFQRDDSKGLRSHSDSRDQMCLQSKTDAEADRRRQLGALVHAMSCIEKQNPEDDRTVEKMDLAWVTHFEGLAWGELEIQFIACCL